MEVLWWPDFLKFISDFLTFQIFFWSSRLFAPWLKTMIFQRSRMKFTKEFNSWNSRSNFQNALNIFSDIIFLWNLFSLKGIPLYFRFRTSRAPVAEIYVKGDEYKSATPPPQVWYLNNHLHMIKAGFTQAVLKFLDEGNQRDRRMLRKISGIFLTVFKMQAMYLNSTPRSLRTKTQ